jgi:hypothetical protein
VATPEFDRFWEAYPRKIGRLVALEKWNARRKEKVGPDDMITAAQNYGRSRRALGTEEQYIMHPKTFLGEKRLYEDWVSPTPDMMLARPLRGKAPADPRAAERKRRYDGIDE